MSFMPLQITLGHSELNVDTTTFTEHPIEVTQTHLDATDWTWDGTNIVLTWSISARTVGDQVRELHKRWALHGIRAVRSDELIQIAQRSEDWDPEWRLSTNARIFFAGTIYTVQFAGHVEYHVYAARFDARVNDWQYGCENFDEQLRPGDRFACMVAVSDRTATQAIFDISRSFPRRVSYLGEDRPFSIRKRYGG